MTTKMTYKVAIENAIAGNITDEVKDKLTALIAQLDKKNGAERKPTANQVANEGYKTAIMEFMRNAGAAMTVTDVIKGCDAVAGFSNQKVSALMRALEADGELVKFTEKRKSYFKVAEEE